MTEAQTKLISTMMELQMSFNDKHMPEWRTKPPSYVDAIWTEAAEAFNHSNWEWWKNSGAELDYSQIKMELIDIWHFVMSELMTYECDNEYPHITLIKEIYESALESKPKDFKTSLEFIRHCFKGIVYHSLAIKSPERISAILASFVSAMFSLEMDWEEVYKLYVGKNTLNSFRQSNGYKKDTAEYKARWANEKGWEDNQYLTEILKTLDISKSITDIRLELLNELTRAFHNSSNTVRG